MIGNDTAPPPAFMDAEEIAPKKRPVQREQCSRRSAAIDERFWRFVSPEPNSGCWLWDGSVDRRGYGQIRVKRRGAGSLRYATHISLALDGRPVPPGMCACHRCDVPGCVNPAHLFVGTQVDNVRDCMAKGRHSKPPIAVAGKRRLKTHCPAGHPLSGDNLYEPRPGVRMCRICRVGAKRRMRAALMANGLTSRGTPRRKSA